MSGSVQQLVIWASTLDKTLSSSKSVQLRQTDIYRAKQNIVSQPMHYGLSYKISLKHAPVASEEMS